MSISLSPSLVSDWTGNLDGPSVQNLYLLEDQDIFYLQLTREIKCPSSTSSTRRIVYPMCVFLNLSQQSVDQLTACQSDFPRRPLPATPIHLLISQPLRAARPLAWPEDADGMRSLYASRARRSDQAVQHYGSEPKNQFMSLTSSSTIHCGHPELSDLSQMYLNIKVVRVIPAYLHSSHSAAWKTSWLPSIVLTYNK